jgi:hypothetical protein
MYYIYVGVSYLHIMIDHVEQGHKEPSEPAQVDDTNPEQEQGKPQCI